MSEYSTHFNGKWTQVYDLDGCIRAIQCRNADNEKRIKYLEEENKKLKEDHYKDNEIQEMKQELEKMRKDYFRGFPISENQQAAIELWQIAHADKVHRLKTSDDRMRAGGCIGGSWSYKFTPTSIGTMGYVKCNICGEEFCFQEID